MLGGAMPGSDDARWILEVMTQLDSPDAELVRDVLDHMARLNLPQLGDDESGAAAGGARHSPASGAPLSDDAQRAFELQTRRKALYQRLRDHWIQVRDLPPCVRQVQILRETAALAYHSQLVADPLATDTEAQLSQEAALRYARQAVERAEEVGDTAELIDACCTLGQRLFLDADFETARRCGERVVQLARQIRSLRHEEAGCRLLAQVAQLDDPGDGAQLSLTRKQAELLERLGDVPRLALVLVVLSRMYIFENDLVAAAAALERAARAIDSIPCGSEPPESRSHTAAYYHRCHAMLHQSRGRLTDAAAELRQAIAGSASSPKYRAYGMAADVAWLESVCLQTCDQTWFSRFCAELQSSVATPMGQWHLVPDTPPSLDEHLTGRLPGPEGERDWRWTDPLGHGRCTVDDGITVTPVMGTGFLSNVSVPRLTRTVCDDFAVETVIDWGDNRRRAGGILVYQDDLTLVRYGAGIHFDGDITLTAKSPDLGLRIVSRGLLTEGDTTSLRLERRGSRFLAWCGDGSCWYRCGEAELAMDGELQVGLFAECTYRDFLSPTRCTDTPVRFTQVKLCSQGA